MVQSNSTVRVANSYHWLCNLENFQQVGVSVLKLYTMLDGVCNLEQYQQVWVSVLKLHTRRVKSIGVPHLSWTSLSYWGSQCARKWSPIWGAYSTLRSHHSYYSAELKRSNFTSVKKRQGRSTSKPTRFMFKHGRREFGSPHVVLR